MAAICSGGGQGDARADQGVTQPGAAFFDLDRTLIAGSSAFEFGRASYEAGLLSRRQLARDAWANVKFRLQGSTDEATDALRERIFTSIKGVRVVDLQRLGAARARRAPAARLPADARDRLRAPGRRAAGLHRHGRVARDGRAHGPRARLRRRHRRAVGGRRRPLHRPPRRPVHLPRGQGRRRSASSAEREGIDLAESYAYSDSESDLPMLRAVGHPVAVNPDATLAARRARGGLGRSCASSASAAASRSSPRRSAMAAVGGIGREVAVRSAR